MKNKKKEKWKKISETDTFLSYEKKEKGINVRLEAALIRKGCWEVYQVCYGEKKPRQIEKYLVKNKTQARQLINELKKGKKPFKEKNKEEGLEEIPYQLEFRREYSGECSGKAIEKWSFSLGKEKKQNFLILQTFSGKKETKIEIVLYRKYQLWEKQILLKIIKFFGLEKEEKEIIINLYYFEEFYQKKIKKRKKDSPPTREIKITLGKINLEDLNKFFNQFNTF